MAEEMNFLPKSELLTLEELDRVCSAFIRLGDRPNPGYAFHTQPPGGLPEWYRQNVIGGPGAFLRVVDDFHAFADAMTNKLVSEIAVRSPERRAASLR